MKSNWSSGFLTPPHSRDRLRLPSCVNNLRFLPKLKILTFIPIPCARPCSPGLNLFLAQGLVNHDAYELGQLTRMLVFKHSDGTPRWTTPKSLGDANGTNVTDNIVQCGSTASAPPPIGFWSSTRTFSRRNFIFPETGVPSQLPYHPFPHPRRLSPSTVLIFPFLIVLFMALLNQDEHSIRFHYHKSIDILNNY